MRFQVVWLQTALDELATCWMRADSTTRQAITVATNAIDQALADDPEDPGESREEGERVYFAYPLGITLKCWPSSRLFGFCTSGTFGGLDRQFIDLGIGNGGIAC